MFSRYKYRSENSRTTSNSEVTVPNSAVLACRLLFDEGHLTMRRMMMLAVLACVACAVRAHGPSAGRHVWKSYTNVRFQYAICYPEDLLVPQGESENGDGARFLAKDCAQLIVFGQNNALDEPLKDASADTASRLAGVSGKVTYKVLKANWFVVSGQKGQTVFYAKTCYSHNQFKSLELTYGISARPWCNADGEHAERGAIRFRGSAQRLDPRRDRSSSAWFRLPQS